MNLSDEERAELRRTAHAPQYDIGCMGCNVARLLDENDALAARVAELERGAFVSAERLREVESLNRVASRTIAELEPERDAAIARAEAAEARAGALSRALAAVRINAEDKLLAEVAHLHSAYDTERAAREKAEAEVERLTKALDDAHVRNATEQDEHSAQRAALVVEVERLRALLREALSGARHDLVNPEDVAWRARVAKCLEGT